MDNEIEQNGADSEAVFGDLISSYSRAEAIADGVLVDLSAKAPEVCSQHYKAPVACTAAVWAIIEKAIANPKWHNDLNGVVHDILWMSLVRRAPIDESTVLFQVIIKGAGRRSVFVLKMTIGPGDDFEPVGTLSFRDED